MQTVQTGTIAPSFELLATDGKRYASQEALAQGPLLAAFFKVSCPTCQYTLPFIERLYQQFRDRGVRIWGISQDEAKPSVQFAKEFGVTFPILLDGDHYATSLDYGLKYVPTLFLIGRDGRIELTTDGFSKADLLEIQRALSKHLSATLGELFRKDEKIPEYKPG